MVWIHQPANYSVVVVVAVPVPTAVAVAAAVAVALAVAVAVIFEYDDDHSMSLHEITMTSHERHGVWTHRHIDCLLNILSSLKTKQRPKSCIMGESLDLLTKGGDAGCERVLILFAWINWIIASAASPSSHPDDISWHPKSRGWHDKSWTQVVQVT